MPEKYNQGKRIRFYQDVCYTFDRRQMNKLKIKRIKRQKIEYRGEPCRRKGLCGYKKARYRFRVPYLSGSIVFVSREYIRNFHGPKNINSYHRRWCVCAFQMDRRFLFICIYFFFFLMYKKRKKNFKDRVSVL